MTAVARMAWLTDGLTMNAAADGTGVMR